MVWYICLYVYIVYMGIYTHIDYILGGDIMHALCRRVGTVCFPSFLIPFVQLLCIVSLFVYNMYSIVDRYIIWIIMKRGGWCRIGYFPSFLIPFVQLLCIVSLFVYNMYSIVDRYMIWIIMKRGGWFRIGCFPFFLFIISVKYR